VLSFTPSETTPDLLYYQCEIHDNMGWRINIVNSITTASETPTSDGSDGGDGNNDDEVEEVASVSAANLVLVFLSVFYLM
jgi:hypothetical protein